MERHNVLLVSLLLCILMLLAFCFLFIFKFLLFYGLSLYLCHTWSRRVEFVSYFGHMCYQELLNGLKFTAVLLD